MVERMKMQQRFTKRFRTRLFSAREDVVGAAAYFEVFEKCFAIHPDNLFRISVEDLIALDSVVVVVEEVDAEGRWTTLAGLHLAIDDAEPKRALLKGVVVDPDRMSQGFAKLAVAYAIFGLWLLNVRTYWLTVRVSDEGKPWEPATSLYCSLGFVAHGGTQSQKISGNDLDRHFKGTDYQYVEMHADGRSVPVALAALEKWRRR